MLTHALLVPWLVALIAAPVPQAAGDKPTPQPAGSTPTPTNAGPEPTIAGWVPAQNWAIYLGYKGHIDTDFAFSEFFAEDHTVTAWYMPQYPYADTGPIVAENGGGTYAFGQDDYRLGDGGNGDAGNPVFFVQVGSKKVIYLLPGMTAGKWMHVAVVRKDDKFSLYTDGVKRTPVRIVDRAANTTANEPEIQVTSNTGSPTGTLRFGRRTDGTADSNATWQTYGLIDDIAVFDKALSKSAIEAMIANKRLTGHEAGLLAGWSFEEPASNKPLPPKLNQAWTKSTRAYHRVVKKDRSTADNSLFDNPLLVGALSTAIRLPFAKDEVWEVIQGQNDPGGSHNGSAAFTYDFRLAGQPQSGTYPNGTAYAPVQAAATGLVVSYRKDGSFPGPREPYFVRIRVGEDEMISYLHLDDETITSNATGGTCDAEHDCEVDENDAQTIQQGARVAKLGPMAAHLHFGGRGRGNTIPVAFTNYWASDDGGATWKQVLRGHPLAGQKIKRTE